MPYKILLLDLDGTTVASSGTAQPSQRVVEAVQAAQAKLQVSLATGRPLHLSKSVAEALGLRGPSVFNGGAEIVDLTSGRVLHQQLLDIDTLKELLKLALPFGYSIYTDDDQYGTAIHASADITHSAAKMFIEAVKTDDALHILAELAAVESAAAHPTTSWTAGNVADIHITHALATKRHGVEKLLQILGVDQEQVIAIGDGHNDIPLLEGAGFKVAMGNAPEEVKAIADYVAQDLDNDGVAEVIEKFILG